MSGPSPILGGVNSSDGKAPWTRTKIIDIGGKGDFVSFADAIAFINTQTRSTVNRWGLLVADGFYTEPFPTILPTYTHVAPLAGGNIYSLYNGVSIVPTGQAPISGGAFITVPATSSLSTVRVDCDLAVDAGSDGYAVFGDGSAGAVIDNCLITGLNNSASHDHSMLAGSFIASFNNISASGHVCHGVNITGPSLLRNCQILGVTTTGYGVKVAVFALLDKITFADGATLGPSPFTKDIYVAGGSTCYVNDVDPATIQGTVIPSNVVVGKIMTNQSAAASVSVGTLANKLPIYDAAGTLLGYIPIYTSIT